MNFTVKNIVLMLVMLAAAGLGSVLRPTVKLADSRLPIPIREIVPVAFDDWREAVNLSAQVVDPQRMQTLELLYSETLSRTYVNKNGYRIMLSIAYGKNQRDGLELHKPELCYPAQGFTLKSQQPVALDLLGNSIAATRLLTYLSQRIEPLTYWTVVGDHISASNTDKKIQEIRYALGGVIPDGMLIRISAIDENAVASYVVQQQFADAMIRAIAPEHRARFAGQPNQRPTSQSMNTK